MERQIGWYRNDVEIYTHTHNKSKLITANVDYIKSMDNCDYYSTAAANAQVDADDFAAMW